MTIVPRVTEASAPVVYRSELKVCQQHLWVACSRYTPVTLLGLVLNTSQSPT